MVAVIKKVSHGKRKGEFRFNLVGDNEEVIATSETYTQKHNVADVLEKYFKDFKIVDKCKDGI